LIVKNENENRNGIVLNGAKRTQKETFSSHLKGDLTSLPSFKQIDYNSRQNLYRAKLRVCHQQFDFRDQKKDVEMKNAKKETLIELIDNLQEGDSELFCDIVLQDAFKMISENIFRTFTNKTNVKSTVDPDEDEPHLEEAWPHL
jgi:serine/threonine-protein phosphatase 2A regulatory subunit B'